MLCGIFQDKVRLHCYLCLFFALDRGELNPWDIYRGESWGHLSWSADGWQLESLESQGNSRIIDFDASWKVKEIVDSKGVRDSSTGFYFAE